MFTLPNGSVYKLLLIDTNILSNICKNKNNEKQNFCNKFISNKYAPCFSFQSVLEIYTSSLNGREGLYQEFLKTFSNMPNIVLFPYRSITNQEIDRFLQKESQISINKCMNAFSKVGQNETYDFDCWIKKILYNIVNIIDIQEKDNIETALEWQNARIIAKKRHNRVLYPPFEKDFFQNFYLVERPEMVGRQYSPDEFIAIKMMSITKYDRIYGCSRFPVGKNDVNDVFISAYIPYMDAIIMEKHQVDLVKQSASKLQVLKDIERFTIADIKNIIT